MKNVPITNEMTYTMEDIVKLLQKKHDVDESQAIINHLADMMNTLAEDMANTYKENDNG